MKPLENLRIQRSEAGKKSAEKRRILKENDENQTVVKPSLSENPAEREEESKVNNILLEKESKVVNENFSEEENQAEVKTQEEKRKKVPPKKENTKLSFPNGFESIWLDYVEYRKGKKKSFRFAGDKYEQQAIDKFVKTSNSDPEIAKKILNQSIVNNWEGLFELKELKANSKTTATTAFEDLENGI